MSILKTIMSLQVLVANKVLVANEVGIIKGSGKLIEKFMELKIRKLLKALILSKSQKLAKLGKKLSKRRNSLNFNAKESRLSFLTSSAKEAFNYLQLAFIKAPIL